MHKKKLRMRVRWAAVLLAICLFAHPTSIVAASQMYGVTSDRADNYSLVQVDTSTGGTNNVFNFNLTAGFNGATLAYYAPTGKLLLASARPSNGGAFAVIDPIAHTATEVSITGLPAGQTRCSGIEYDALLGNTLVSFGDDDSNTQRRIAAVSITGAVTQLSGTLDPSDIDYLNWNPATSQMTITDTNNLPFVAISNIFSSPSYSTYASPPVMLLGDGAFSDAGVFYVPALDTRRLMRLSGNSYVDVGPFGTPADVLGLAFVPEPAAIALLPAILLSFRRRNSLGS